MRGCFVGFTLARGLILRDFGLSPYFLPASVRSCSYKEYTALLDTVHFSFSGEKRVIDSFHTSLFFLLRRNSSLPNSYTYRFNPREGVLDA